jgi:hypothetical protein
MFFKRRRRKIVFFKRRRRKGVMFSPPAELSRQLFSKTTPYFWTLWLL